jgi:hypothetical protein
VEAVPDDLTHRVANAAWGAILNERDGLESGAVERARGTVDGSTEAIMRQHAMARL